MAELTQERLKELLDYDHETGVFTWRVSRARGARAGGVAGCVRPDGYRQIGLDGKLYFAHRLAWLSVHGRWPVFQIDHINGVPGNDWIENLREAKSDSEQRQNQKLASNNTSGYAGVTWHKGKHKWLARIWFDGKGHFLGYFDDLEEAARVRRNAKKCLHTFCPETRSV